MRRNPVDSSSLASAGYDGEREVLEVEFRNGGVYDYLGVPAKVYRAFMEAESKGRYLNAEIKPCFAYRTVRRAGR